MMKNSKTKRITIEGITNLTIKSVVVEIEILLSLLIIKEKS